MHKIARMLVVVLPSMFLLVGASPPAASSPTRTVYLAGQLSDEALISLGAEVACQPGATLLLDTTQTASLRHFLLSYRPDRIVPVGEFPEGHAGLIRRLGVIVEPIVARPRSSRVFASRADLLLSAYDKSGASGAKVAIVCNPHDTTKELGRMSLLAPYLAARKRAILLLTNERGDDVAELVENASKAHPSLDTLILLGNLKALPVLQRPNPIPDDKDTHIDLEPLTPKGLVPFTYVVGRLFHEDLAMVPLMLARQQMLAERPVGKRRALVASNPGGGLSLLEAFSRNTAKELGNTGYDVTCVYGDSLNGKVLRKHMPEHDVILWEGHHNILIKDWGFLTWDEPLPSSFVFLQSCLALQPEKVQPLLSRGAIGVVGTSTRTYSGSGGAFSLAYFNALLYDGQSLGASLRSAKNFLLAYIALKEKRLGSRAARTGANYRAAWAFSLWGDPTFHLPQPTPAKAPLASVRITVDDSDIWLSLPSARHEAVKSDRYSVHMPPNGRLAGLIRKTDDEHDTPVVPMVFAEVALPHAKAGATPTLKSRMPSSHWVFLWDARRKTGYLLVLPRTHERAEVRFRVEWSAVHIVERTE